MPIFVTVLRYVVPIEVIEANRPAHVVFLDKYYANGTFITSGAQTPRTGGVIIAQCTDRKSIEKIMHEDPFYTLGLAEYQIFEFSPTKYSEAFKACYTA